MGGGRGGQEGQVALREVGDGVKDRGFGAVEAGGAQNVHDGGPEEGAVKVVGLGGHCSSFRGMCAIGRIKSRLCVGVEFYRRIMARRGCCGVRLFGVFVWWETAQEVKLGLACEAALGWKWTLRGSACVPA